MISCFLNRRSRNSKQASVESSYCIPSTLFYRTPGSSTTEVTGWGCPLTRAPPLPRAAVGRAQASRAG